MAEGDIGSVPASTWDRLMEGYVPKSAKLREQNVWATQLEELPGEE
jgi:hypothetical protein